MNFTIDKLLNYLGRDASFLLDDLPFRNWSFERSVETDLEEPLIDYVFIQDGFDFVCDQEEKVSVIFLFSDQSRSFNGALQDLPFDSSRQAVLELLGSPSKSGDGFFDPILGEQGPWDRFDHPGHSVHVQYRTDSGLIGKITLMRADIVP